MTQEKSRGIAFFLSSIPVLGWFGWDKLYMGAYTIFFIQLFATLLVMGCIFSFPIAVFTSIMILLSTYFDAPLLPSFLFPQKVTWSAVTKGDRVLIGVMVLIYLYIAVMVMIGFLNTEAQNPLITPNANQNANHPLYTILPSQGPLRP
jgi:hypothetical protein